MAHIMVSYAQLLHSNPMMMIRDRPFAVECLRRQRSPWTSTVGKILPQNAYIHKHMYIYIYTIQYRVKKAIVLHTFRVQTMLFFSGPWRCKSC